MGDPPAPLAGLHILLVEEDYLVATEVARWLRAAGADVMGPVARIEQACGLVDRRRPDAAVLQIGRAGGLEIGLGGDTVFALADRLDVLGVPYLLATGDRRLDRLPGYSGKPRIEKPLQEPDLVTGLKRLLDGARAD